MIKYDNRPLEDWVKVRGHLEGSPAIYEWQGNILCRKDNKTLFLFKIKGFNICKFVKVGEKYQFLSRELSLYTDKDNNKLKTWINPFTNIEHHVCHIANESVCHTFDRDIPAITNENLINYSFNIHPSYPNPLKDTEYNNIGDHYYCSEIFNFTTTTKEILNPTVNNVMLNWQRIGPWLPWMGEAHGELIYVTVGRKATLNELDPVITSTLEKLPKYKEPPNIYKEDNVTSWSYFKDNTANYESAK